MKNRISILPFMILLCRLNILAQTPQWALFETDPFAAQMVLQGQNIWIHTIHGLVQVDINTSEKTVFNTLNSGLNNHRNTGLGLDASGNLWVASELDGLYTRNADGTWQTPGISYGDSLLASSPPGVGPDGQVYLMLRSLATNIPYLLRWENQQLQLLTFPPDFKYFSTGQITVDQAGDVWLVMPKDVAGFPHHLLHLHQGNWQVFSPGAFDATLDDYFQIPRITAAPDGAVFIHTYSPYTQSAIKNKVFRLENGQIELYKMPYLSLFEGGDAVNGLAVDQENRPWVATSDHQLWRYNADEDWTPMNLQNLGVPTTGGDHRFLIDAQNRIFVLGINELYMTDGQQAATSIPLIKTDIADFQCWGLAVAPSGRVWYGGANGVSYFDGDQWTALPVWGEQYRNASNLQADSLGNVWYLPISSSTLTRCDGQQYFTKDLTRPNSFYGYSSRTDLDLDRQGNKWICTGETELLRVRDNQIKYYVPPGAVDSIRELAIDAAGNVWAIGRQIYQLENDALVLKYAANFIYVHDAVFQGNALVISDGVGNIFRYENGLLEKDSALLVYSRAPFYSLYPRLAIDETGNLWAGTYSGLFQKHDQGPWVEISTRTSRSIDNFVEHVRVDACNNVWFWAFNALMVYNPDGLDEHCALVNTHSVQQTTTDNLSCQPNPATSLVRLSLSDANTILTRVNIFAADGRCVLSVQPQHQTSVSVPVQHWTPGWYSVIATDGQGDVHRGRFLVLR
jgi:ligand-binding sensor domain-containing protein